MAESATTSMDRTEERSDAPAPPRRLRRRRWAVVIIVVAAVIVIAAAVTMVVVSSASPEGAEQLEPVAATAVVERRDVSARQQVNGQLGYSGELALIGHASGTLTAVPAVGQVLSQGDVIYRVDGDPVVLLTGATPVWRNFTWGVTGSDARQLNAALVSLGYADGLGIDPNSDMVTWTTQRAVERLQDALGLDDTGVLGADQVIFTPSPVRVTAVGASLGSPVGPGQVVISGTSTEMQVSADIRVELARDIAVGDAVAITLPDQSTTVGTVQNVGTVATQPDSGAATVPVTIALDDPASAGGLDKAPVLVAITTATVEDALVVPVTALLALTDGGYAIEVVEDDQTRLIAVELGLFDSGGGVVEVIGEGLEAGQRVVVPAT